jgi:hypothetical protein
MLSVLIYALLWVALTIVFATAEVMIVLPQQWDGAVDWSLLLRPGLIATGTLLGFWTKSLADQLTALPGAKVRVRALLSASLRAKSFWGSLTVAPLVLLLFYRSLDEVTSASLVLLLAYENAFFFRSFVDHAGRLIKDD